MPRNLTPLHLRCEWGECPSIHQMDSGEYLIVGRSATMAAACEHIPVGEGEHAVTVSGELLGNVVPGWKTIDSAPNEGHILVIGGPHDRPTIRPADGDFWRREKVGPTHWMHLPAPPETKP